MCTITQTCLRLSVKETSHNPEGSDLGERNTPTVANIVQSIPVDGELESGFLVLVQDPMSKATSPRVEGT